MVDDAFRPASRALGAAIANAYTKRLAFEAAGGKEEDLDLHAAKAKVAALLAIDGVADAVEAEAEKLAKNWLAKLRVKIRGLAEDRQDVYRDLASEGREPQEIDIVVPKSRIENTKDHEDNPLATRPLHLLSNEKGEFPVGQGRPGIRSTSGARSPRRRGRARGDSRLVSQPLTGNSRRATDPIPKR